MAKRQNPSKQNSTVSVPAFFRWINEFLIKEKNTKQNGVSQKKCGVKKCAGMYLNNQKKNVGRRQEKGKGGPGSRKKSSAARFLEQGYPGGFLFPFLPSLGPAFFSGYSMSHNSLHFPT